MKNAALLRLACSTAAAAIAVTAGGVAFADSGKDADAISYHVTSDTYAKLFRRATAPGPGGALVTTEAAAPFYQFALLSVRDLDLLGQRDSVDVEISLWGDVEVAGTGIADRRLDGDVTMAYARYRHRYGNVTLGRQVRAGGAARFVRFDGVSARAMAPFGLGIEAYGGFMVLPRWSAQPGYQLLGSAGDTLLRDPDALPEPERARHWLAGVRAFYEVRRLGEVALSFHEQHAQNGLDRRDAAAELSAHWIDALALRGRVVLDADSGEPSDARAVIDVTPIQGLSLAGTYSRVVPALFLSRQSVLSVFTTDAFDEVGGEVAYRPLRSLALSADGYALRFAGGGWGARGGGGVRFLPAARQHPVLGLGYRRVREMDNGYHGLRVSLGMTPLEPLQIGIEAHSYLYDAPIATLHSSWITAASARWTVRRWMAVTLGGSLARSPYALLDAQVLARLELFAEGGAR